jgi:hypothetical protein
MCANFLGFGRSLRQKVNRDHANGRSPIILTA